MKTLFICKKNEVYGFVSYTRRSSGLFNSTRFIVEGLEARGVEAKIIEVNDNNDIDREVTAYKPEIVVIEALWVVPEKFDVLKKLHPHVRWFVHLHSNMPFLSLEGIAMNWILEYVKKNVGIIANSRESYDALLAIIDKEKIILLPNVYIGQDREPLCKDKGDILDVGCFGAVRPLKNQLLQALAAIQFAKMKRKYLKFHINASRIETGGQPVMKNLVQLFEQVPYAELVQEPWMEPDAFLDLLQTTIDIGMQVSLTETFNVVNADYVTAGIASVVSNEVRWASLWNMANAHQIGSIVSVMDRVYRNRLLIKWNQFLLSQNSKHAQNQWFDFVKGR